MTYAETKGKEVFDWNEFLNAKHRTEDEWSEACALAGNWCTCACGSMCDVIPRHPVSGKPCDEALGAMGDTFYDLIYVQDVKGAKSILEDIEERSAELIAEITCKPSSV